MNEVNKEIGLSFGCLSDAISEQLDAQGYKYDPEKVARFEQQADAINVLRFGLLTDSMLDKIIPKLYKEVIAHVVKKNGLKVAK